MDVFIAGTRLIQGDCLDVMRTLNADSIDSIVTDPPYGLSFMGKNWDHGIPGKEFWVEALRVAKPGAHLLAFGGTRTFHRLVCAIEDAGWEIRDCVMWVYGCLSDDTEILTDAGWVRYNIASEEQHALAFDTTTGRLQWEPIRAVFTYWHDGEMVSLHSEHTDQLVTINHRVILEDRPSSHAPYVPSDEDLRRMLAAISGDRPLSMAASEGVLEGVPIGTIAASAAAEGNDGAPGDGRVDMRMWGDVLASTVTRAPSDDLILFADMQRAGASGAAGAILGQRQGHEAAREGTRRAAQSGMEGRRYRVQEARELLGSAIRPSTGVGSSDGAQGWVRDGAPVTDSRAVRLSADAHRGGPSRGSRPDEQCTGQPDALASEPGSQAIRVGQDRTGYVLPSTAVTASRVDYAGVVWCINVPSGAFLARRNGQMFVTGNSGFPKSLDVSKAIDKKAGAKREVGPVDPARAGRLVNQSGDYTTEAGWSAGNRKVTVDPPATDAAKEWQGWGTALKPAWEPIIMARKPREGTVAANVLEYGTGALNIDGCRVEYADDTDKASATPQGACTAKSGALAGGTQHDGERAVFERPEQKGRWPANLIHDGSEEVLGCFPDAPGQGGSISGGESSSLIKNAYGERKRVPTANPRTDKGSAARFFYCAKANRKDRSANNNHPTVKPTDLMRYLCRLVTPPGGVVLDPFMGSGSTGKAAMLEGFAFIGIELEAEYWEIAKLRVAAVPRTYPMAIYFSKTWWTGETRDEPGEPLDPQPDWPDPKYRSGWIVRYTTSKGRSHVGKIRYVFRDGPGRLDFYYVIRLKNDGPEITVACSIKERIQ